MSLEDLTPSQQAQLRLGAILLEKNPEIALEAKRLAKRAEPSLRIPEVDLEDKIAASSKATDERVSKLEQDLIEERVRVRRAERAHQAKEAGVDIEQVEKLVAEQHFPYDAAIKYLQMEKLTAEPAAADVRHGGVPMHSPLDLRPAPEWRKLQGSQLRLQSSKEAHAMVDDIIKQRRFRA